MHCCDSNLDQAGTVPPGEGLWSSLRQPATILLLLAGLVHLAFADVIEGVLLLGLAGIIVLASRLAARQSSNSRSRAASSRAV